LLINCSLPESDFCVKHAANNKWSVHGRVDGPVPEAKLKEFETKARNTASKPAKPLDAAAVATPVRTKRPRDVKADGTDNEMPPLKKTTKEAIAERKAAKEAKAAKKAARPKRAMNAYAMFFSEHRIKIVESLGAVERPMCAAAKKAGEMWKALGDAGQTPYRERAAKAREELLSEAA